MLSVVGDGLQLIHNGQEAGNPKCLAFFEQDPIRWQPHTIGELYSKLFALKQRNTALWKISPYCRGDSACLSRRGNRRTREVLGRDIRVKA